MESLEFLKYSRYSLSLQLKPSEPSKSEWNYFPDQPLSKESSWNKTNYSHKPSPPGAMAARVRASSRQKMTASSLQHPLQTVFWQSRGHGLEAQAPTRDERSAELVSEFVSV